MVEWDAAFGFLCLKHQNIFSCRYVWYLSTQALCNINGLQIKRSITLLRHFLWAKFMGSDCLPLGGHIWWNSFQKEKRTLWIRFVSRQLLPLEALKQIAEKPANSIFCWIGMMVLNSSLCSEALEGTKTQCKDQHMYVCPHLSLLMHYTTVRWPKDHILSWNALYIFLC